MSSRRGKMSGICGLLRMALVAVMALVFGMTGLVASSEAAVSFDNGDIAFTMVGSQAGTTPSGTIAKGTGNNRLLVVIITVGNSAAVSGDLSGSTVQYGGQNLTPIASTFGQRSAIWAGYLKEAGIAAASNTNITTNLSTSSVGVAKIFAAVMQDTLSGALDDPIQSFATGNKDSYDANPVTLNTPSNSLTIPADGFGFVGCAQNGTGGLTWTPAGYGYEGAPNEVQDTTTNTHGASSHAGSATDTIETNITVTPGGSGRLMAVAFTVNPAPTCADTNGSAVTLTTPTNGATVSGSISITTSLNNASSVEYSIDGGAWISDLTLWNSAITHPTSNTAPVAGVTVDVRAIEDECGGYVTDSITVTVDNTCSESQPSVIWTAQSTAAGDFSGLPFVTLTNIAAATMEYQVTEGSGAPPAFSTYTENFVTGNNFGSWVASDTDATAQWLTLNGQTPSGTNTVGPTVDQSGSGFFAYTEATGATYPYDSYLVSPSIDAVTYAPTLDFYWNKNHAGQTYCELYVDASSNDGATWDNLAIWNPIPPTLESADGATWTQATIDLSGISPTGGQDNIKVRFRTVSGGWQCDTGLDTITIDATPRTVETTVIPWTSDPIPGMANLTNGNTYNLYARGLSSTCGVAYYGDSVANAVSPGTSTTFGWSACTETANLTLQPIINPITGDVIVTASGTATGIQVGIVPAPANASGWTYTPAQDDNSTVVDFYATGTGTCGPLTASQLGVATNTMAAPNVTAFTLPATVVDTTAPLVVPVTTFTASDNVAVTGYMITESATAPLAGAAGWSVTAPTSYTVAAYGPYTLYAWAKDAKGNVSLSSSAPVTISNCVETGTVALAALPNPITGAVAVSATLGGGATAGQVSFDGGSIWVASGSTYTPTPQYLGTNAFAARATGLCGGPISALANPTIANIDTRTAALVAQTASVSQGSTTSISVVMPYLGDKNGNAAFKVDYRLIAGTWSNNAAVTNVGGLSPYTTILSGLTVDSSYEVRVIYADADGTSGTLTQNFTVTLDSWVDYAMLHNSNRFTGTTKHSGDWGTPTGAKGPILCSTCHTRGTPNIKLVTTSVALAGIPGAAETVSYTSAIDGSSDLASATGNHSTSNRVCEVCHTYDNTQAVGVQVHAYDMSGATVTQQSHYLGSDCIKCHEHKVGFKASCTGCHASPPLATNQLTATLNPANTTASTTAGKHALHANTKGYGCNTCHSGWEAANEMPKSGNINIGFNAFGKTTGAYVGRTIVSGGKYTAAAGTTLTQTKVGATTTCAFYCHGSALPVWSDTATAICGSCHGMATGMPSTVAGDGDLAGLTAGTKVGKHSAHVVTAGYACVLCHNGAGTGTAKHVDGNNDVVFDTALAGVSVSYSAGSCSNLSCHSNAAWNTTASGGCTFCHGYPPTSAAIPANNKHAAGVTAVNHDKFSVSGVVANHDDCSYCHGVKGNSGVTSTTAVILDPLSLKGLASKTYVWATDHRDGKVTINGDTDGNTANDAGYNTTNAGCGTAACHANDASHQLTTGGAALVTLKDFGPGACSTCHSDVASGAPQVTGASTHTRVTTGGTFGDCTNCHSGHYGTAGGANIPNNPTVGINYGHGGIKLGGTGTAININGVATADLPSFTTEAEICWGCHDAQTTKITEWGTNAGTGSTYNYGALSGTSTSNWVGATWTSGTAKFGYKTGLIQSTHSVNPSATVPGVDAVADIRCSYCHDVHDLNLATGDTLSAAPYLRGTWLGNPYREDGAPLAGDTWTASGKFGAVPRGGTQSTQQGGFQIDQNNANPTTGWTANSSAGLCELCHGNGDGNFTAAEIDSLNTFGTASTDWVGTNGHSAAVLGGGDSVAANIFTVTDRNTTAPTWINNDAAADAGNPAMAQQHVTLGTGNRAFSFRSGTAEPDGWNLTPRITGTYAQDGYNWGADTNTALDSNYHNFSCSKCHNPHASRLPRLMITNCLDTKHNTWDDGQSTIPNGTQNVDRSATVSANNSNVKFSQATSAQNCHRVKDPAFTQSRGTGWNKVTPW